MFRVEAPQRKRDGPRASPRFIGDEHPSTGLYTTSKQKLPKFRYSMIFLGALPRWRGVAKQLPSMLVQYCIAGKGGTDELNGAFSVVFSFFPRFY